MTMKPKDQKAYDASKLFYDLDLVNQRVVDKDYGNKDESRLEEYQEYFKEKSKETGSTETGALQTWYYFGFKPGDDITKVIDKDYPNYIENRLKEYIDEFQRLEIIYGKEQAKIHFQDYYGFELTSHDNVIKSDVYGDYNSTYLSKYKEFWESLLKVDSWEPVGKIEDNIVPKTFLYDIFHSSLWWYPGKGEALVKILNDTKGEDYNDNIKDIWNILNDMQSIYEQAEDGQVLKIDKWRHKRAPSFLMADDELWLAGVIDTKKDKDIFTNGNFHNMHQVAKYWKRIWLDSFSGIQNDKRYKSEGNRIAHEFVYNKENDILINQNNTYSVVGLLSPKEIYKRFKDEYGKITIQPEYTIEIEFDGAIMSHIREITDNTMDINSDGEWGFIIGAYQDENGIWNDLTVVRRGNSKHLSHIDGKEIALVVNRFNPNYLVNPRSSNVLPINNGNEYIKELNIHHKERAIYYQKDVDTQYMYDYTKTNFIPLINKSATTNVWKNGRARMKISKTSERIIIDSTDLKNNTYIFSDADYNSNYRIIFDKSNIGNYSLSNENQEVIKYIFENPCHIGLMMLRNYGAFRIVNGDIYDTKYLVDIGTDNVYKLNDSSYIWENIGNIKDNLTPKTFLYDVFNSNLWWYPALGEKLLKINVDSHGNDYNENLNDVWEFINSSAEIYKKSEDGQTVKIDKWRHHKYNSFVLAEDELQFVGVVDNKDDLNSFKNGLYNMKNVSKYWKRIWLDAYSNIQNDLRFKSEGNRVAHEFYYDQKRKVMINDNFTYSVVGLLSPKQIRNKSVNEFGDITYTFDYSFEVEFDGYILSEMNRLTNYTSNKDSDGEWGIIIAALQDENGLWHDLTVVRRSDGIDRNNEFYEEDYWKDRQFELVFDRFNPETYSKRRAYITDDEYHDYWDWLEKNKKERARYYSLVEDKDELSITNYISGFKVVEKKKMTTKGFWKDKKCRMKVIKTVDTITIFTTDLVDKDVVLNDNSYLTASGKYIQFKRTDVTNSGYTNEQKKILYRMFDEPCYIGLEMFHNYGIFKIINGDIYDVKYLVDASTNDVYQPDEDETSWEYVGRLQDLVTPRTFLYDIYNNNLWWYPARDENLVKINIDVHGDDESEDDYRTWEILNYMQNMYDRAEDGQVLKVDKFRGKRAPSFIMTDDELWLAGVVNTQKDRQMFMTGAYRMKQAAQYWHRIWLDAFSNNQNDKRVYTDGYTNANQFYFDEETNILGHDKRSPSILGMITTKEIYKRKVNEEDGSVTKIPEYTFEVEFDGSLMEKVSPFHNVINLNGDDEWGIIVGAFQDDDGMWHDVTALRRGNGGEEGDKWGGRQLELVVDRFNPNNYKTRKNLINTESPYYKLWLALKTLYGKSDYAYKLFKDATGIDVINILAGVGDVLIDKSHYKKYDLIWNILSKTYGKSKTATDLFFEITGLKISKEGILEIQDTQQT